MEFVELICVWLCVLVGSQSWAAVIPTEDLAATHVTGHLSLLDSGTGHAHRIRRRQVENPRAHVRRLRLTLTSLNRSIDLQVSNSSVWDLNSDLLVRQAGDSQLVSADIHATCYLAGQVVEGDGYGSFSFCNSVSGIIQTQNETLVIGDLDLDHPVFQTSADPSNDELSELPVKIFGPGQSELGPDSLTDEEMAPLMDQEEGSLPDEEEPANDGDPTSVAATSTTTLPTTTTVTTQEPDKTATVEVGIYINSEYLNVLGGQKINTTPKILDWVINRWNIIRGVFSNKTRIGADMDIKIKKLEIWWDNPPFYANASKGQDIKSHLHTFCKLSPDDKMDHKMMYTWETGKKIVGLAYVGGICQLKQKCSTLIPDKNGVQRELHELGHNLGLSHDPKMAGCGLPYGFMGWQSTTLFQDCYRPVLMSALTKRSRSCLFSNSQEPAQVLEYRKDQIMPANQSLSDLVNKW